MNVQTRLQRLLLVAIVALAFSTPAQAQFDEQTVTCISAIMKSGVKMDSAHSKQVVRCIKHFGIGRLPGGPFTADRCIGDIQQVVDQLLAVQAAGADNCPVPVPPFGLVSPDRTWRGVMRASVALAHDVFGDDIQAGLLLCSTNSDTCACQWKVAQAVEKLSSTNLKLFLECNRKNLPVAMNEDELDECVDEPLNLASLAADYREKITKAGEKLADKITNNCTQPGVDLATAFPGACSASPDAASLAACLDRRVDCRVCTELNEMEGLAVDCDVFDDGADNGSCAILFQPTQSIDGHSVTCSSVETNALYSQCNDFRSDTGEIESPYAYMSGGVTCGSWSTTNSPTTDNLGLCQSMGFSSMEAYYDCDGVAQSRWSWNDHTWAPINDTGYTRNLRCYF